MAIIIFNVSFLENVSQNPCQQYEVHNHTSLLKGSSFHSSHAHCQQVPVTKKSLLPLVMLPIHERNWHIVDNRRIYGSVDHIVKGNVYGYARTRIIA